MNDYRRIHRRSTTRRSRRLTPHDTRERHYASRRFLGDAFAAGSGDTTVVVTHHGPSLRSLVDPGAELNQCYASDLEPEIEQWQPALWVHGHVHARRDYRVGDTRILCNPAGLEDEESGFDPCLIVTLD